MCCVVRITLYVDKLILSINIINKLKYAKYIYSFKTFGNKIIYTCIDFRLY